MNLRLSAKGLGLLFCSVLSFSALANLQTTRLEEGWGLSFGYRSASIPFKTEEKTVTDIAPMFYYEHEHFYLDGLGGGVKVWKNDQLELSLFGQYRFFDIPQEAQNSIRGDGIDYGLSSRWKLEPHTYLKWDIMSDDGGRAHTRFQWSQKRRWDRLSLEPYAHAHLKSDSYNTRYFGLDLDQVGADIDVKLGLKADYRVWRDFHVVGHLAGTMYGPNARKSEFIEDSYQTEAYLGIAFFNSQYENTPGSWPKGYWRVGHTWGTSSNLSEIIRFNSEKDPYNNQMSSLFYGHMLSDTLLGWPIEVYLTPGVAFHHSSEVQGSFPEYVLAVKAYYTFTWPIRWRFGAGEGLSYATEITYLEEQDLGEDGKGYEPSKLLNYLDLSLDLNVGDLFRNPDLDKWWFGYYIHHRSGIFESSSIFGRIKGGSNYQGLYVQYHW